MNKLKVHISTCRSGEILAKDVISEKGVLLAVENLMLNEYIILKLEKIGIKKVWLYREASWEDIISETSDNFKVKVNYKETVLAVKSILNDLATGKRLEYDKLNHISESIYKNLDDMDSIIQYLRELKNYDDYTFSHCANVAFYGMLIGKWLNMSKEKIMDIIQAGLLHDIGKVKIPVELLNKTGRLTDKEFEAIKKHSLLGFEMVKTSDEIGKNIKEAVLNHHERVDGSGYPARVTGDFIGEYAKIIAIADVYDAMTSDRSYKKRSTPFDAFHMFLTTGTSAFESSIVRVFLLNFSSHLVGVKVQLDNGDIGEVVYIPPHEMANPVIRIRSSFVKISRTNSPQIVSVV